MRGPWIQGYERIVAYNGIKFSDKPNLHGEGITIGPDYMVELLELGIGRVEHIYELVQVQVIMGYMLWLMDFAKN